MTRNQYISNNLFIEKLENNTPYIMEAPHSHEAYEIFFLTQLEGTASIMIEGEHIPMKEGCVVIIDSKLVHRTDYSQSNFRRRYLIEIHPSLLKKELGSVIDISIPDFFRRYTGVHYLDHQILNKIENVIKMVYDESIFREKYYEDIVLLRVLEIIILLNRNCEEQLTQKHSSEKQAALIDPVVRYIVEHIREELSLTALAEYFYIDKTYLARSFKLCTGQTVHEFINQRKIEHAKRFVTLHPTAKTKYVADYMGIKDTSYFCKLFKKYTGMTLKNFNQSNETF